MVNDLCEALLLSLMLVVTPYECVSGLVCVYACQCVYKYEYFRIMGQFGKQYINIDIN